jgi:hypothetical protein
MNDAYMDFSFDDGDSKIGQKTKRFKAKEGETYRVSLVWVEANDDGSPNFDGKVMFTGCERHYIQGVGYFLHKGPEFARIAGGPPKQSVATIIALWPTDDRGRINQEALKKGEGIQTMPWTFSAERYDQIKRRNDHYPLTENDLLLSCTDTQYQKMDVSNVPGNLFRKMLTGDNKRGNELGAAILSQAQEIAQTIRTDMARELTLEQLREKMGGASAMPSGGAGGGAAENVDDLLDDLIE